jgi:TolA-binding protein
MNNIKQFITYIFFCLLLAGCGKTPEKVFTTAEESFTSGNFKRALKGFTQIVNHHESWERKNEAQEYIDHFPSKVYSRAESLRNEKEFTPSIDALKYIVNNYGNLDIAPKSQYLIGDIFMNDLKDFDEAIVNYKNVVIEFPETKEEPHAQFMVGYIFANVKNDSTTALMEYKKFLDKYPEHELAPSVEFEINWLGKDINEIPTLKHISS